MHHNRRKSGQGASGAPATDVRSSAHRSRTSGGSYKKAKEGRGARSPTERDYEYWAEDAGRDTFPQYW